MIKSGIDQDAMIDMFSQATTQQGEALRKAVSEATLKALQGRELTLKNIRGVLKTVTEAASTGAARHCATRRSCARTRATSSSIEAWTRRCSRPSKRIDARSSSSSARVSTCRRSS